MGERRETMTMKVEQGKRLWMCDGCGRTDVWGESWQWYGSLKDLDDSAWERMAIACSDQCRSAARQAVRAQGVEA